MSRNWNVHCRTCNSTHPFVDANHQTRLMLALGERRPVIEQMEALIPEWFANHRGHDLVATRN